jgi:hypothetical protein
MMGSILMLSVGAVLSGLFLGLRDLAPYLTAQRSGVIARKGARDVRIRRDEDPVSFSRLLANRSKGATGGFGLFMLGVLGLSLCGLAFAGFGGPLAIVIFAVYVCFALFAAFCLIRGFISGHMFAFWGLTLFGGATRNQNPTWFWAYAAINLFIVLGGLVTILQAVVG